MDAKIVLRHIKPVFMSDTYLIDQQKIRKVRGTQIVADIYCLFIFAKLSRYYVDI